MPNLARQGRAPSTINKQMAVLSEMLKLANRSQFILHAPYEGVSRLKLSKNDPDPLLLHEYQALIAALPRCQALIIIVAVHTGMRPALDARKEQYAITGSNPKQDIRFHHRENRKTEQQSLRFVFSLSADSSFIASQMEHEDARMVYEVYSRWTGDMNQDQVNMLNNQMPTALPPGRPHGRGSMIKVISFHSAAFNLHNQR